MSAEVTFFQMVIIFFLILVGFACRKAGLISDENNRCLSRLMVFVFNPAIILSSMTGSEAGEQLSIGMAFLVAASIQVTTILIAALVCRWLTGVDLERRLYQLMFAFSNVGFIGIPVIRALFGAEYLIYVAVFILEFNVLIYTYGYALLNDQKKSWKIQDLKPMLNMGTLACALSLFLFFSGIRLPQVVNSTVDYLGDAAVPISLIIIGVNLGQKKLASIFTNIRTYIFCILKLVLVPVLQIFLLKKLPIPADMCQIYAVLAAMPVGTMPQIMAVERGIPDGPCSDTILLSTILSIVTIPLVVYLYPFL